MTLPRIIYSIIANKPVRNAIIYISTGIILISFVFRAIKDPSFIARIGKDDSFLMLVATLVALGSIVTIPKFLNNETKKIDGDIDKKINSLSNRLRYLKAYRPVNIPLTQVEIAMLTMLPLEENIQSHIGKLQRNSIVNLMIGIIGTLISVGILTSSILSQINYKDVQEFLLAFVPRLSFVIFIQLFAFFFLRLYKGNLEDSKYFQNELTNMLSKSIAIKIAFQLNDSELIKSLVVDLSKTERNFKLAAGESLLNIERTKIEKDFDLEMLNTFKDFLKANKKEQ